MSNKQEKKFRKSIRKSSKDLAQKGYAAAMFQIGRQRDIIFIIAILLFLSLGVSIYFNIRWFF